MCTLTIRFCFLFQSDVEVDDSFVVLVPCYRNDVKQSKEVANTQMLIAYKNTLDDHSDANAGLLSGSTGIESVPGPELQKIEFLNKFNEENQKRYAENDTRFKDSPVLKELLEKSKLNKEKLESSAKMKIG